MWSRSTKQRRAAMRRKKWLRSVQPKMTAQERAIMADAMAAMQQWTTTVVYYTVPPPKDATAPHGKTSDDAFMALIDLAAKDAK